MPGVPHTAVTFLSTVATKSRMLDLNQLIPVLIRATASWRLLGSPSSSVAARLSALNELNSKARNRFSTFEKTDAKLRAMHGKWIVWVDILGSLTFSLPPSFQ